MLETLAKLVLAFAMGFGVSTVFRLIFAKPARMRALALVLVPPALLFAVFLVFFDGAPIGEDWIWLGVGFVYFWPWYLAWTMGYGVEVLRWKMSRRSKV